jgi:hypothetical protein
MDINRNHATNMSSSDPHLSQRSASNVPLTTTTTDHRSGQTTETSARKKCHGNKKLQRFRKRRRARGMSEAAINKTIEARKREKEKQEAKRKQHQQQRTTTSNTTQSTKTPDVIPVSLFEW